MNRFVFVFLLLTLTSRAQLVVREADSLSKHYTTKVKTLLDPKQSLNEFYTIDLYGVSIYASAELKKSKKPEYRVTWQELPIYKAILARESKEEAMRILREKGAGPFAPEIIQTYSQPITPTSVETDKTKPLAGMRIAIDPGHFANDSITSRIEDKYIDFYLHTANDSTRITFYEAQLTWLTAKRLTEMLHQYGAEVLVTIPQQGMTALGKTYADWKRDDYQHALDSMLLLRPNDANLLKLKNPRLHNDDRLIFRYVFRDVELRKRAALINAFHPDLTVIIHFNVDEKNTDWKTTTTKNFCMAFVGGSFHEGELSDSEKRYDFLRLLLTDDLDQSIGFSGAVTKYFALGLQVPLAKKSDAEYLEKSCVVTSSAGVYGRNLSLCRLVQGTLIYGETLYQDNEKECKSLYRSLHPSTGQITRTDQIAQCYLMGIMAWHDQQRH